MTMKKRIKTAGAMTLAAITVLSAAGLSSVYGALGVETDKKCSLTFEQDTTYPELQDMTIPVDLYRVAEITEEAQYTAVSGYESLEVDKVSSTTTAQEWEEMAEEAMRLATEMNAVPTAEVDVAKDATTGKVTGTANDLATGLYLVAAETVMSPEYIYDFAPYLVSLPNNYYSTENPDDTWVYDVTAGMKPHQELRYGDLEIVKTLRSYNTSLQDALFVFQVEGVREGENVYSDVVTMNFQEAGQKSVLVKDLPAGTVVTVTEIYSGGSYKNVSEADVVTTTIIAEGEEKNPVSVSFTNEYDGHLIPGTGIVNHFEKVQDGEKDRWQWEQRVDDTESVR